MKTERESDAQLDSRVEERGAPGNEGQGQRSAGGLPYGVIAAAAAGFFLLQHSDDLATDGGFIVVIGAVILGILSANMLSRS